MYDSNAHAVLAAALSVSKCNETAQTSTWKQRALVARSTLHRLSGSLRKLADRSGTAPDVATQLLQQLDPGVWDWKRDDAECAAAASMAQALERRSTHLQQFIKAVEVWLWLRRLLRCAASTPARLCCAERF